MAKVGTDFSEKGSLEFSLKMSIHLHGIFNFCVQAPSSNEFSRCFEEEFSSHFEIRIDFTNNPKAKNNFMQFVEVNPEPNGLYIRLPKVIFFKEILEGNQLDRVTLSKNGRLLMCGKIVMQLNQQMNEIDDIGAFVLLKDYSNINYKFYSLIQPEQRKFIN